MFAGSLGHLQTRRSLECLLHSGEWPRGGVWDADFGPAFINIRAYFPYPGKVWLNGHE